MRWFVYAQFSLFDDNNYYLELDPDSMQVL